MSMLLSGLLLAASSGSYHAGRKDTAEQQELLVWPSTPPEGMPCSVSRKLTGISFTGRFAYYGIADTWYGVHRDAAISVCDLGRTPAFHNAPSVGYCSRLSNIESKGPYFRSFKPIVKLSPDLTQTGRRDDFMPQNNTHSRRSRSGRRQWTTKCRTRRKDDYSKCILP